MSSIDLPGDEHLTPQEAQSIRLLLEGLTPREAADALGLKRKTVYWHVLHVHQKLGTHSVMQVRCRLEEMGVLEIVMRETNSEPVAK